MNINHLFNLIHDNLEKSLGVDIPKMIGNNLLSEDYLVLTISNFVKIRIIHNQIRKEILISLENISPDYFCKKIAKFNTKGQRVNTRSRYFKLPAPVLKNQKLHLPKDFPSKYIPHLVSIDETILTYLEPVSVSFIKSLAKEDSSVK